MDIVTTAPGCAASIVWQAQPGIWVLTVAFKATFSLRQGEAVLASEQDAARVEDRYGADDRARSLYCPSDLVPIKPRADVLLVGAVYAPAKRPTRSVVARLAVAQIDKSIEVFCDRTMQRDGEVREGAPFASMPLAWERAAGGPDTLNPVGVLLAAAGARPDMQLPNLQLPGTKFAARAPFIDPVAFGPIAPTWPSRHAKLGRHAATWSALDWHKTPLPPDVDPVYFNSAPPDQQVPALRDDERIVLDNLHPTYPLLVTSLPGVHPRAYLDRGGDPAPVAMRCDTLWIDTERSVCTLTWRGQVRLEHPTESGAVLIAMEQRGQQLGAADVERLVGRRPEFASPPATAGAPKPSSVGTGTRGVTVEPFMRGAELPFAPADAAGRARRWDEGAPQPRGALPFAPAAGARAATQLLQGASELAPSPPAPADSSPWAASPRPVEQQLPPARSVASGEAAQVSAEPGRAAWAARAPAAVRVERSEPRLLVWFDADSVPRIRRKGPWREVLLALEQRPFDDELDDPALSEKPVEVEDRREIFEILARGEALDGQRLNEALGAAVRSDGKFIAPLVLLEGDLAFPFDELAALRATVGAATPFAASDENLKGALAVAAELLKVPDLVAAPAVPEGLSARIRDAFTQPKRAVPAAYLETQIERALLERRHYQRRDVFGAAHLRALLHLSGATLPAPVYLPATVARRLPMFQRFKARLIAELHMTEDQNETHPAALRALALARVMPR
jgi:hypothetical protein